MATTSDQTLTFTLHFQSICYYQQGTYYPYTVYSNHPVTVTATGKCGPTGASPGMIWCSALFSEVSVMDVDTSTTNPTNHITSYSGWHISNMDAHNRAIFTVTPWNRYCYIESTSHFGDTCSMRFCSTAVL
jgi:hypothetical protein